MNKRQRKKMNRLDHRKRIIEGILCTMNKIHGDSTNDLLLVTTKSGKIVRAFKLINVVPIFSPHEDRHCTNELEVEFKSNPIWHNEKYVEMHRKWLNYLQPDAPNPEINPQIWEYGGIKRLEYLFFKYCVQRYAYGKNWASLTIYDLAEDYISTYPRNNMKQLLYYIRKWQNLQIVSYNLDPFIFLGVGLERSMLRHYRDIFTNTINAMEKSGESIIFTHSFN